MKKISSIALRRILMIALAVVLVLGAAVAVLNIHAPGELSIWQKREIEYYWEKTENEKFLGWHEDVWYGMKYYTSENGWLILFAEPEMFDGFSETKVIAGYEFKLGHSFYLLAYKNGVFYELEDAYQDGWVSEQCIIAAYEAHKAHIADIYRWYYDSVYGSQVS